ncbi:RDD family protein [Marinigracilibium pacificum]|uniref:RDD family protein n=1 Tax=Marinigracilibium pacificum TaxID=2729599 RepID=A0A848IWY8_9BACT|nr:RDD family protein [Marinigracilibium pacificum]NMM48176.1 RDD family protein [Marinigracilibium pacificum]
MQTIEINTSQNVIIRYELAGVMYRLISYLLDVVIIAIGVAIQSLLIRGIFSFDYVGELLAIMLVPQVVFYSLFFEIIWSGQTPGKRIMKIQVVKMTGEQASWGDYFLRWALKPIDIMFSFGSIGVLSISSTKFAQRVGDIAANTTVIKLIPKYDISLNDILKLSDRSNYEPMFPQVTSLNDEYVLALKEVKERTKNYDNQVNQKLYKEIVDDLIERLEIKRNELKFRNKDEFVSKIIDDYVSLTR